MNKGLKILLIVACILVIVGTIIAVIAFAAGAVNSLEDFSISLNRVLGFIDDDIYEPPMDFEGSVTIDVDGGKKQFGSGDSSDPVAGSETPSISSIDIDWIAGEVVITGGAPEFSIEENNNTSYETVCTLKNGHLSIKYKEAMNGISLGFNSGSKDIAVRLPAELSENLHSVSISTASANVNIANLTVTEMDIETASGDCDIFTVNIGEFDFDSASGDIEAYGTFGGFSSDTASGNTVAEGEFGEFSADAASGNVELIANTCPYEVDITTVSGNADVVVPEDSSISLEFETVSGSIRSDHISGKGRQSIGSNPSRAEFDIETVSGDLIFDMVY